MEHVSDTSETPPEGRMATAVPSGGVARQGKRRRLHFGAWLARGLLVLLFLLGAYLTLVSYGRANARAALLLPALVTASQPAPLVALGNDVRHTQMTISARSGPVYLDIYAPTAAPPPIPGAREGVLILSGVGDNRSVDQLVNLSAALARSGLVAMDVTTPTLISYVLSPNDSDAVVRAFQALARFPGVGTGRAGILGFSAGGALACLAAADPRIRDQVAFITLFGSYFDATQLLRDVGQRAQPVNGRLQAWQPNGVPLTVLANSIATTLSGNDALLLTDAFDNNYSFSPLNEAQIAALSPPARAAYHLLAGDDPRHVDANIATLSPRMRSLLHALSPDTVVGQLHAQIYLLHDRNDVFVPFTESRDFDAALNRLHHPHDYQELSIFQHVEVRSSLDVGSLLHDGAALYHILSELLLPAS